MNACSKRQQLLSAGKHTRDIVCGIALFVVGCSTPKQSFLHTSHRGIYGIGDEELQQLQFYIQRDVLVHAIAPDGKVSATDVVIVPANTPGVVKEVGPNWLRVAFQPGGTGAVFLASDKDEDSIYKLATEVEGKSGYYRLEEMRDPVLLHDGQRYRIIDGAGAYLQIGQKEFEQLVKTRAHLKGVKQ